MKKRVISAILVSAILAGSLMGCGQNKAAPDASNSSSSSATIEKEADPAASASTDTVDTAAAEAAGEFDPHTICDGVTITIAVPENTRISDWKNNDSCRYIEEKLGVNLEFEVYPSADFTTKINTMVTAGDKLPDLIFSPGSNYVNWISEGAIRELSDLYADENLSANIRIASEGAGYDIIEYMRNGDGEIYGFPGLEQSYGFDSKIRFWVYKPWCDQLGVDVPTSIDEYLEICRQVINTDMNGNGSTSDEKALVGYGFNDNSGQGYEWFPGLMSAFVYSWDANFFTVDENDVVGLAYTTDAWKEGLKYIKQFFDEGIIDSSIFTGTEDDAKAQILTDGPTVFSWSGYDYFGSDLEVGNQYVWTHLTNPDGENGYSYYKPVLPSVAAVMSADCENPEAAFLVCDIMCDEYYGLFTRYGKEGEDWAYWDQVIAEDVLNPDDYAAQGGEDYAVEWISTYKNDDFWSSTQTTDASWLQCGPFIRNKAIQYVRARQISADTPEGQLNIDKTTISLTSKDAGIANKPPKVLDFAPLTADETVETAEILVNANAYVSEMTAAFLTGKADIDAEWDSYLAQLETIGIDTLIADYQAGYDRAHK